jgi:DNA-binding LytR/AlgR family response regulator
MKKKFRTPVIPAAIISEEAADMLRLKSKKKEEVYVQKANVIFVQSMDHWVDVLVKGGKENEWFERHCTLKAFLTLMPASRFLRVSKFYAVDPSQIVKFDRSSQTITFKDSGKVTLRHPLNAYRVQLLMRMIDVK